MWKELIQTLSNFGNVISSFFNSLGNIISTIISIIQALRYGTTTLLTAVWDLVLQIFDGGVFINVGRAFDSISYYIGGPATVLLATFLFIIIVRIGIAFVFKILKLNIDYHTKRSQTNRRAVEDMKRDSSLFK